MGRHGLKSLIRDGVLAEGQGTKPAEARLWRLWQVETSFACDLACVMCPWKGVREQSEDSGLMDASVWAALRPHLPLPLRHLTVRQRIAATVVPAPPTIAILSGASIGRCRFALSLIVWFAESIPHAANGLDYTRSFAELASQGAYVHVDRAFLDD